MRIGRKSENGAAWYITYAENGAFLLHDKIFKWLHVFAPEEDMSVSNSKIIDIATQIGQEPKECSRELLFLRGQKDKRRLRKDIVAAKNMKTLIRDHEIMEEKQYWSLVEAAELEQDSVIKKTLKERLIEKYSAMLERLSKE